MTKREALLTRYAGLRDARWQCAALRIKAERREQVIRARVMSRYIKGRRRRAAQLRAQRTKIMRAARKRLFCRALKAAGGSYAAAARSLKVDLAYVYRLVPPKKNRKQGNAAWRALR